ncbi:endopeptidase La [Fusibacter tunisiensis]|uniref:Lon protease n=1 Tax=Fusibacter tunisiensis TaxID=1008308 RepID=A0ABS2MRZ6_9FIRM|nr:endopeptidase La [Fusibacter tunisiensis]MBM7562191.1 ATP-dependent Lon protease [Fusibacter tunisiensis]
MEPNQNNMNLPLIPLRGLSIFPYMVLHFDVGRKKSIKALEAAMAKDQKIFLTTQFDIDNDAPDSKDFYKIGTVCKIKQMLKLPGDAIRVLVEGIQRGEVETFIDETPYFRAEIKPYIDATEVSKETRALMRSAINAFEKYISISNRVSPDVILSVSTIDEPGRLADIIAAQITLKTDQKQQIINALDVKSRLELLLTIILTEIEILEVEKNINDKVKSQINKSQKEYYLREQIKAIRDELGEEEAQEDEIEDMRAKLKKLKLSKKIEKKVSNEIDRYSRLSPSSAESGVIRSYVNWILELPWKKETKDEIDLVKAQGILDEDHYGLESVKERVVEYLAVRDLTQSMKGPIICLVGPPGVGKTSIAKSIARSLNREFVRMSLGGVRDEAEIRGHRRTYIGAIPGRIINGIKEAGTKNPVFLFDEIDKLSSDFRGDPASALLEVLDPEQNKEFTDHYLEVPFDLSKVMFLTTANSLNTIPRPLLDRMEVIQVSGYTEFEKLNIAKKYLVPKKMEEHGLKKSNLTVSDDALLEIIRKYTRESGVRELERKIADLSRKAAVRIAKGEVKCVRITDKNIDKYLGKSKYHYDLIADEDQIGIVTGLAWTAVGGDTLSIEVNTMKGKGKLQLTGQLGDVMKESAQAGLSYIRTVSKTYGIDENFHEKLDMHVHIPEGAIPKDGPSAGITMATAMISALSGIPVDRYVAMTGEITLRGRVLPIGGFKEKALAAKRAGIHKILFPYENLKDLEDIPETVRKEIEFVPVKTMDEVLKHALSGEPNQAEEKSNEN